MIISLLKQWNKYLEEFPSNKKDVYFTEEYVKLYESSSEQAFCFICKNEKHILLFPILRREFIYRDSIYFDFETPYGYGGPISNNDSDIFKQAALKAIYDFCVENCYIAGFTRFHPLLSNEVSFTALGDVVNDRDTVAIDLSLSEDEIWKKEINTKNRNTIKKGIKNGLHFVVDDKFDYLDSFIELYNRTMKKLSAENFYYFDNEYYQRLKESLGDSFLGVTLFENRIVSAAIFFYSKEYGHYHLSGSDADYLYLSPNNFMLYHAALELKRRGVEKFHLGGGTSSDPADSLLGFKSRFSQDRYKFCFGKSVFNKNLYKDICIDWSLANPDKAEVYKYHLLKYKY